MSSQPEKRDVTCPTCKSKARRFGTKKEKLKTIQRYQCKKCRKIFTLEPIVNKTYPVKTILNAISIYNLGNSQTETINILSKKFRTKPSQKTISNWLNEYKPICPYHRLRNKAKKLHGQKEIIESHEFLHNNLPYNFQFHKAKLELLFKDKLYNNEFHNTSQFYEPMKQYLQKIPTKNFPHHIFKGNKNKSASSTNMPSMNNKATSAKGKLKTNTLTKSELCPAAEVEKRKNNEEIKSQQRASQLKFSHLDIKQGNKQNLANKLASLALNLATTNKQRHQAVQNFMLINDSTTIAVEIPIYLTNWDAGYYRNQKGFIFPLNQYKTPITGHIGILQIRNGLIHLLDYKPEANKQNPINQLTIYALALSRKLNLPLYHFKCAWFDENNYYEFFPLHAVYPKH